MTVEKNTENSLSFWEHLDVLRGVIIRIVVVVVIFSMLAFLFKDEVFSIILAPKEDNFILYRLFCCLADKMGMPELCPGDFSAVLINTQLTGQFVAHITISFYVGLIFASPYIIYKLFEFVLPALYENERKYSMGVVTGGYFLFMMGVAVNYFIIFPLTFRFLSLYQVSNEIQNTIMLTSYIDSLMLLSILMGIMFEIPVVSWLLAKLGVLKSHFMKEYRKHAYVISLVVAAVITPTSDVFTLLLVSIPIFILYEASILLVRRVE